jgi:predicted ATPase
MLWMSALAPAWFLPELYRIRGEIAVLADSRSSDAAEASFTNALRIAGEQGALSWELRTANSMALLWRSHGRADQVPALLIPIVDRFPKGSHVLDLEAARGLLRA